MAVSVAHEALMYAVYFAPRGKKRLYGLGHQLAQRHLSPFDKLIGFIGDAGAGKSLLIKGMFPGLELTNDDEGINMRPLPLLKNIDRGFFSSHTYHMDVRFESAFTQMHVLVDAVKKAVNQDKRVIVEHFDLIYPYLGLNAEVLVGIGEEVIVTRPNIFGPQPQDIADIVFKSIRYRKMAHTAEDLTSKVLEQEYGLTHPPDHGDVKHGFVLEFSEKPDMDIYEVEKKVLDYIENEIDICYLDDNHIRIGDEERYHCTGPRIHVRNAGEIENFRLLKEYKFDPISKIYNLVGLVGEQRTDSNDLNKLSI
ncbi:alanine-tRNA synthetase second additional domain-containing protein [Petroclostridium sp. X23]|uniref:alanine-tRNA synthetase second additional domain-containing protein n=1 Tax=Petroclostridium sp. X23 TaxID=3045146 RepID=UPI0024ACE5E5|nr:alanine-tRNA synthetase second additional domain-containing protein [Petroclostridium sp. X23]WHH61288.1 alanine-tRNA synthetase second additional domain-containing protein [Petroclostridium sp. X23]